MRRFCRHEVAQTDGRTGVPMQVPWRALALQLRHSSAGVLLVAPDGCIVSANRRARGLFRDVRLRGSTFADLFHDPVAAAVFLATVRSRPPGYSSGWNTLHRRGDGWSGELFVEATLLPRVHGAEVLVTIYTPPSEIYEIDPLTGCGNRRGFDHALHEAAGRGCLAILDLNDLKRINDRFGHPVGDQVLVTVAGRLLDSLSDDARVFRLAGDEFGVLFADPDVERASVLLFHAMREAARPLEVEPRVLIEVTAAAGLTAVDARPLHVVVSEAHAAQHYAKRHKMPYAIAERDMPVWARQPSSVLAAAENLEVERDRLTQLARTDPLTMLPNRLALEEDSRRLAAGSQLSGVPYSALFVDLDHFSSYNHHYGDDAGDKALIAIAEVMRGLCRGEDSVYRKGGEEFVLLLPKTYLNQAVAIAERLRMAIVDAGISHEGRPDGVGVVTAVLGVAQWSPADTSPEQTWTRASRPIMDLKRDKQALRNRVLVSDQLEP